MVTTAFDYVICVHQASVSPFSILESNFPLCGNKPVKKSDNKPGPALFSKGCKAMPSLSALARATIRLTLFLSPV